MIILKYLYYENDSERNRYLSGSIGKISTRTPSKNDNYSRAKNCQVTYLYVYLLPL